MPYLEKISAEEGAGRVVAWEFHRPITHEELACEHWYAYRDFVVTWLEPTDYKNVWCPHLVVRADRVGKPWPLFRCWEELKQLAAAASDGSPTVIFGALDSAGHHDELFTRLGFTEYPDVGAYLLEFGG